MCLSSNMKNLITASDQGIIYIWRLPDALAKALSKIKADARKIKQDFDRIPSVVQEVDEEDYDESKDEKDFDFEIPDNLNSDPLDDTVQKQKKVDVIDVLSQINKASAVISKIKVEETQKLAVSD